MVCNTGGERAGQLTNESFKTLVAHKVLNPDKSCGKKPNKTKLSQDPKACECASINPRVPRETLTESTREREEKRRKSRDGCEEKRRQEIGGPQKPLKERLRSGPLRDEVN